LENSPLARNAIRQTFSHVFLDEFQDCTNEQYKLIQSAFGGTNIKLTAVAVILSKKLWDGLVLWKEFSIICP
jgi:ATP-dependent exoDNAse (exonuclease V) beta subunit